MNSKLSRRKSGSTARIPSVPNSYSRNGSTQQTLSTSVAAVTAAAVSTTITITTTTNKLTRSRLSGMRAIESKWKGINSDRRGIGGRSRVTTLNWADLPLMYTRTERNRDSLSTAASSRKRVRLRLVHMLSVAFFSSFFVAAMRRVVARYHKRVIWETVEKPKAAFKIQTAWRAYLQRRRMRCKAVVELLGPILHAKIKCIRIVKEKCALFLQRIFRSQRDRHRVHWLYQQMRYNRALNVVRKFLERYVAKRYLMFITLQRDERVMCEEHCAMKAQSLIREERAELLKILHWMNRSTQLNLTPLVTKSMLEYETMRCTGYSARSPVSLVTWIKNTNKNFSLSVASGVHDTPSEITPLHLSTSGVETMDNCDHVALENDNLSTWTSLLHNEESARHLIDELFRRKIPSYPLRKEGFEQPCITGDSNTLHESVMDSQMEMEKYGEHESFSEFSFVPSRPVSAGVKNDVNFHKHLFRNEFSFNLIKTPLNGMVNAFIELLVRTESIERKALVSEYRNCYNELMQQVNWVATTLQATTATPPLYASLLTNMQETWVVQRAELLFRQEHENRIKLIEEYESIPLRFLNRPLLNIAAEERRARLLEGVRKIQETEEASESMKQFNSTSETGEYQDWKSHKSYPPQQSPTGEKITMTKSHAMFQPAYTSTSRPPLPPSPPPRKREDISTVTKSVIIPPGGRRSKQQQQQQQVHDRPMFDVYLPGFSIPSRALSPDSVITSENVRSTNSMPNTGSDLTNNIDREAIVQGKLSTNSGKNAKLPSVLSFFTPPDATKNTNTNNIVEFTCSGSNRHAGSISSVESEAEVLPRLKLTSSGGRLGNSGCNSDTVYGIEGKNNNERNGRFCAASLVTGSNLQSVGDSLLLTKSTLGGNQTAANSTMRGLPIPLLRASPNLERSTVPPLQTVAIVRDKETVKQKESGADYVCDRRGRRVPSPLPTKEALAAAATLQEDRCTTPSSLFSPVLVRSVSPVKIRIGRSIDPRKKKAQTSTTPTENLSNAL
ncbi:IQ motif [Trypanosoma melophagium]|uniref:IQ motif n=1 Tax=Trypanosoma melophagium TaxID=715481 RepID=UPI003519D9F1|nr:IQ motif [Trypanosoma melophagium]